MKLLLAVTMSSGCATNKPILYSSAGTTGGGEAAIAKCHALAGAAGRGAGIGAAMGATAALISSVFSPAAPNPAYRAFVERCLRDRSFEHVGWQ